MVCAIDSIIRQKFNIRSPDVLPYCGDGTRRTLAELFRDVGYTLGAEVGVLAGDYSEFLLDTIPGLRLMCIDPWVAFESQGQIASQDKMDHYRRRATARLSGRTVDILAMKSGEAAAQIDGGSLDFVYIDGNHEFDHVMTDLIAFAPKVRVGGIVAGHDFAHWCNAGVVVAVEAYVCGHDIKPWYVTREQHASWFWVQRRVYAPQ
jgi:hypothetical protein